MKIPLKKSYNLLFVIIFILGNNLYALNTKLGTFNIHNEFFYYDIDKKANATAIGGFVEYKSKKTNNIGFGFKAYGSHLIFSSHNPQQTLLVDFNNKDLYPIAKNYIYYQNNNINIETGYIQLDTPLMNNDNTRLIPYSYGGIKLKYKFPNNSYLYYGYINKIRDNISEYFTNTNVSFLGYKTDFANVNHQWYYYYAPQLYNSFHIEVDSSVHYNNSKDIIYGIQSIYTFQDQDTKLISAKLGLNSKKSTIVGSISYNFGDDGVNRGYGGLSSIYTTSMVTSGKKDGKPFTTSLKARYKYYTLNKDYEYSSAIYLTNVHYKDKENINSFYIDHKMNFRLREYILIRYEKVFEKYKDNQSYFRIISAYKF